MNHLPGHVGDSISHVLISGGTHGNEYTGAFLARQWLQDPTPITRKGFSTHVLFANQQAFRLCKRYVERDLNRSFSPSGVLENPHALEIERAKEIEAWLNVQCDGQEVDVIFDLHSTTASMGMSLVLTNQDPFNLLLYAYLKSRFSDVNAYLWEEPNVRPGFLNSLATKGFAIEVGPVANGVLSAEWVVKTSQLVQACLDFIVIWNSGALPSPPDTLSLFRFERHVDYPRGADGLPSAMIHPDFQNKNFQLLKPGDPVFLGFDGCVSLWEEAPAWAVFINEAAYYEKGIAFTLTDKIEVGVC
jgi:aspartoacylase